MAKVVDITEKLSFDENPKLVIKGEELEVNAGATTVLKLMGILGENTDPTPSDVVKMYELIFSKAGRTKIEKMGISFNDLKLIISAALGMIIGEGEQQGE